MVASWCPYQTITCGIELLWNTSKVFAKQTHITVRHAREKCQNKNQQKKNGALPRLGPTFLFCVVGCNATMNSLPYGRFTLPVQLL